MSNQIKLSITGMSCGHCVANVEKSISTVEGVEKAVVSLEEASATVDGDMAADTLIAAITEAGYNAKELNG
ncbi:MAG: cation transporter [Gammaproteobacteria bacterium]|nr:cation transporter [Gammaproteobacteria bacterium]